MGPLHSTTSWSTFARGLARTLHALHDGDFLIVAHARINYYVQFAHGGARGLRAEAVSNTYIEPPHAVLTTAQYDTLRALGWQQATQYPPEDARALHDPPGSPNFFRNVSTADGFAPLAAVVTTTLRDVYGIRSPQSLRYHGFHNVHGPFACPDLPVRPRREAW
jgi:hypothetical protein